MTLVDQGARNRGQRCSRTDEGRAAHSGQRGFRGAGHMSACSNQLPRGRARRYGSERLHPIDRQASTDALVCSGHSSIERPRLRTQLQSLLLDRDHPADEAARLIETQEGWTE